MIIIKSFSVGNGDCFYIKHGYRASSFTIIDCYENDKENFSRIIKEIKEESRGKNIIRFISTHPDRDHIEGIERLFNTVNIHNFYCVENKATKADSFPDFDFYRSLRDGEKSFYIYKDCERAWMNKVDDEKKYGPAGINVLWPDTENVFFKEALKAAKDGKSFNNISPVLRYDLENGVTALWLGDMEHDFLRNVYKSIQWPKTLDILFAPHHGRDSGKVPDFILNDIKPKLVIIGEAPSEHLDYYSNWNTITQNSAGDITFYCETNKVHVFVANGSYSKQCDILKYEPDAQNLSDNKYLGTLNVED